MERERDDRSGYHSCTHTNTNTHPPRPLTPNTRQDKAVDLAPELVGDTPSEVQKGGSTEDLGASEANAACLASGQEERSLEETKGEEDGKVDEVVEEVEVIGNNEMGTTEMRNAGKHRTTNNS